MLWKSENDSFPQTLRKTKSQKATIKKIYGQMQIESFILGLGGYSCAIYLRPRQSGNTKRGGCNSSASEGTFMHLYYKKCASSSKLTVLSKALEVQLGICLSGLALFTCCFFFFFRSAPPWWWWWWWWGGTVGCFLKRGEKEGVFVSSILVIGE